MIDIPHEIYLDSAFFYRLDQNDTSLTEDKDKTTWNLKWTAKHVSLALSVPCIKLVQQLLMFLKLATNIIRSNTMTL